MFFLVIVTDCSSEYCSLGWHLWSLKFCRTSVQVPMGFRIFIEMSDIILMTCLYVLLDLFPFSAFNILSSFWTFRVLIILCAMEFLFVLHITASCAVIGISSFRVAKLSFIIILLQILSGSLILDFFSFFYIY